MPGLRKRHPETKDLTPGDPCPPAPARVSGLNSVPSGARRHALRPEFPGASPHHESRAAIRPSSMGCSTRWAVDNYSLKYSLRCGGKDSRLRCPQMLLLGSANAMMRISIPYIRDRSVCEDLGSHAAQRGAPYHGWLSPQVGFARCAMPASRISTVVYIQCVLSVRLGLRPGLDSHFVEEKVGCS